MTIFTDMIDKLEFIRDQLAFRIPRQITSYIVGKDGYSTFYCPSCNAAIERDYQSYCCCCGQAIRWDDIAFINE